jgi:hypothetical protein
MTSQMLIVEQCQISGEKRELLTKRTKHGVLLEGQQIREALPETDN